MSDVTTLYEVLRSDGTKGLYQLDPDGEFYNGESGEYLASMDFQAKQIPVADRYAAVEDFFRLANYAVIAAVRV